MLKNAIKHLKLITKHKWVVFKLCCKVGIPWRGLIHDLSKYSPTEFFESIKYYQGDKSPIPVCRKEKGYSAAWLHHKGRNKHHLEYWTDAKTNGFAPVIPYKYAVEMLCDKMAAGIVYNGKNWTNSSEYDYWMKDIGEQKITNPKVNHFFTEIFREVKEQGLDKTYTKENFKKQYKKYCIDDKTQYTFEFKGEWKIKEEEK